MPTFYSVRDDAFILSREIKFLLHWLSKIELNRNWMAEFLLFEYTLGDKCLVKNIKSIKPSQLLHLYSIDSGISLETEELLPANFSGEDTTLTKDNCTEKCAQLFAKSIGSRVARIKDNKFNIMADLSGGHDSRAVFAGLINLDTDQTSEFRTIQQIR